MNLMFYIMRNSDYFGIEKNQIKRVLFMEHMQIIIFMFLINTCIKFSLCDLSLIQNLQTPQSSLLGISDYRGNNFASILLDNNPLTDTLYIRTWNGTNIYEKTKKIQGSFHGINTHEQNTYLSGNILVLDNKGVVKIYNSILTQVLDSTSSSTEIYCFKYSFSKNIFFYLGLNKTTEHFIIAKYNLQNKRQVEIITSELKPQLLGCTQYFVYVQEGNNIYIYDTSLNIMNQFTTDYYQVENREISIQDNPVNYSSCQIEIGNISSIGYIFIKQNNNVYVWSINTEILIQTLIFEGYVHDIVFCNNKLYVVAENGEERVLMAINSDNWKRNYTQFINSSQQYNLFCDNMENIVLVEMGQLNYYNSIETLEFEPEPELVNPQPFFGEGQEFIKTSSSLIPFFSNTGQPLVKFFNFNINFFMLYSFHQTNYSYFVWQFSQEMDILSQLRINPEFTEKYTLQSFIQFDFEDQNAQYYQILEIHNNAPKSIYYLESIKGIYSNGLLISVSTSVLFLLLRQLMKAIGEQKCFLTKAIYRYLVTRCKWWMIVLSFFETHLSYAAFYSFYQLRVLFSFSFFDKLNLLATVSMLFIIMIYAITFVPLIRYLEKDQSESSKVIDCTKQTCQGFRLTSMLNNTNTFFRALIHSIFISNNQQLLMALLLFGLVILIICFIYYKSFKRFFYSLTVLFIASILVFDIILLCKVLKVQKIDYELSTMVSTLTIIGLWAMTTLLIFSYDIYEIIQSRCQNNKVQDLPKSQQLTTEQQQQPKKEKKKKIKMAQSEAAGSAFIRLIKTKQNSQKNKISSSQKQSKNKVYDNKAQRKKPKHEEHLLNNKNSLNIKQNSENNKQNTIIEEMKLYKNQKQSKQPRFVVHFIHD